MRKPPTRKPIPPVVILLRHGLELTVPANAGIDGVCLLLGEAIRYFKHQRDALKTEIYAQGSFRWKTPNGRRLVGEGELRNPGDEAGRYLSAAQWTDAVIWAYSTADTIDQMMRELPAFRAADTAGSLSYVLDLLPKQPLEAFKQYLERNP